MRYAGAEQSAVPGNFHKILHFFYFSSGKVKKMVYITMNTHTEQKQAPQCDLRKNEEG